MESLAVMTFCVVHNVCVVIVVLKMTLDLLEVLF